MTIVAVRMDEDTLAQITGLSEQQEEDRSTVIRKLLRKGITETKKRKTNSVQSFKTYFDAFWKIGLCRKS